MITTLFFANADERSARRWSEASAGLFLSDWRQEHEEGGAICILDGAVQSDPAWPLMRRILVRNGWTPEAPVTYRQLQAVAALDTTLMLRRIVVRGNNGGGGRQDAPEAQTQPAQQPERTGKRSRTQQAERQGRRPAQRATAPVRLWHPWPQPSAALIRRAASLLQLVQRELVEAAHESVATGWRWRQLAVRQEMGQLAPARRWERLGVPRLLLALDFSGSMGRYVAEVAALGASLAHAFPWLVVAAAPNAALEPLTSVPDKQVIVDGKWERLPEGLPPESENNAAQWAMLDARWPVAAAIYVGDWEAWRMADVYAGRFGVASVFRANYGAPMRTDHAYGQPTPWPTVIRCNSADDFLAALRLRVLYWGHPRQGTETLDIKS